MSAGVNAGPFHEDFSWLPDQIKYDINARFAAQVRTVVSGCNTIANIAQQFLLDQGAKERTLLSDGDMYNLVALVAPLMSMLDDAAESQISRLGDEASKGAKK